MTPEEYVKRLYEASGRKYVLLDKILALTKEQTAVIVDDNLDRLEELINRKQAIIDEIDKIDEEFDVYFQRLKQILKIKSLEELISPGIAGINGLQDIIGRIMDLLGKISEVENQNNIKAKKLLGNIVSEIKKLNQGKKVTSAYNPVVPNTISYFIDRKK